MRAQTDNAITGAGPGPSGPGVRASLATTRHIRENDPMQIIDGAVGEGGGQILRTSLALAIITNTPVRIERIRANRSKPGLMRQHLTAVRAAAEVCAGRVAGAELGAREIEFTPGPVTPGRFHFSVGTAGSTTLVLQTVLPALLRADGPSTVVIEGGTHNIHAPTTRFLQHAFCPILDRMGGRVDVTLERPGFYPGGGGRIRATIEPGTLRPIELLERGEPIGRRAIASVAGLSGSIAARELDVVKKELGWSDDECSIEQIEDAAGPGNTLSVELLYEHVTEVFTGFGARGVSAEGIAKRTTQRVRRYLKQGVPVGVHLADQLLLPFALAGGGAFVTGPLSDHTTTNAMVIERFLPVSIDVAHRGELREVRIRPVDSV